MATSGANGMSCTSDIELQPSRTDSYDSSMSSETLHQQHSNHDHHDKRFATDGDEWNSTPRELHQPSNTIKAPVVVTSRCMCSSTTSRDSERNIVTWTGPSDSRKPINWPTLRKWTIVTTSSFMTFVVSFSSSVFAPVVTPTSREFHTTPQIMLLGVALYVAGFAIGPMIWGPASELYGRTRPMFFGMFVFCILQIPLALAQDIDTIFVVRFLAGAFGSAPLSILAGLYLDFLRPQDVGIAVSIYSAAVFSGPAVGSVVGTVITQSSLGWRWTAWISLIMGAFFSLICFSVTPETFEPVLLRRKAAWLRWRTGNFALHAKCEEQPTHTKVFVTKYLTKPVKMMIAEPILVVMTIYCSLVYGIIYLFLPAISYIFATGRAWSPVRSTLPFLSLLSGIFLASGLLAGFSVHYVARRYLATQKLTPEDRLPTMILGSLLLPCGLFWLAWTSDPSVSSTVQIFSLVPIGAGIILVFMSAIAYLADVYLYDANSALAISTFVRSLVAAAFPLVMETMFGALGVKWGLSVLGFISIALIPFPILFLKYGRRIRSWSRFSFVL